MSAPLPAWADNPEARALLEQIVAERPDYRDSRAIPITYGGGREPMPRLYLGKPAAQLRHLYNKWWEHAHDEMDAQFHATGFWDEEASLVLHRVETADQLIERALAWPAVPYTPFEIVERDDGSCRVAA